MSDDDKSYSSSANNSDIETDDEDNPQTFKPVKKVILPPDLKTNLKIDSDDDDDDDESIEETENSEDDEDDLSDIGDYNDENAAEEVFNADPAASAKTKTGKKTRGGPRRNEEPELSYQYDSDDEDDEEDDDADGEQYLQKFDEFTKQSTIDHYHPELLQHNHDEIETLSVVVRDNNGNIIDPLHKTLPFLTKYERARILGERAKQIDAGAIPLVNVVDEMIDSYLIALEELTQKKIPFIVKRPLPNGGCEYWKLKDLEFL